MTGIGSQSPNHQEGVSAVSSINGNNEYVYSTNHALDVNATVTVETAEIIGTNANCYTGQVTVSTMQVQLNASSHVLNNGIVVKALSTNAADIIVGLTGVTATTGDIIEPGESRGYAVNNTNLLYIISASSTTDKVSYGAN